jgi:hypothetical protein
MKTKVDMYKNLVFKCGAQNGNIKFVGFWSDTYLLCRGILKE